MRTRAISLAVVIGMLVVGLGAVHAAPSAADPTMAGGRSPATPLAGGAADGAVIVSFRSGVLPADSRAAALRAGATDVRRLAVRALPGGSRLYAVRSSSLSTEALLRRLATDPSVARVEPDHALRLDATVPDDPLYPSLWAMPVIAAPAAWDLTTGASSVVVAVIDTGVRYDHPDLAANMWHNPLEWGGSPGVDDDGNGYVDDLYGIDTTDADSDPLDADVLHSHGTHVAGTIAAAGDNGVGAAGVAWTTRIMALKCFGADNAGTVSQAIDCIDYAVWQKQHGVNVVAINASWGGGPYSAFLRYAIEAAGDAGIVFVASAGNSGQDNDLTPHYPSSYQSRNILAVANSTQTDAIRLSSCWGPDGVDLAAPGTEILSTVAAATDASGYATLTGTSMAAPHVSGTIALCAAAFPSEGVEERIDRVLRGVDLLPAWTDLCATGGRLNAHGALSVSAPTHDDVPGLRLHASPVTGAVSASGVGTDVYRLRLRAGRTLQASVTATAGTNVDLYLFGPAATTAADHGAALASATAATYPDGLCYETPAAGDGTYYLAAVARSGGGDYTISYSVGVNDTIAGAALLTPSPVTGALSAATDAHDVWKLPLTSGQVLRASITGPAGTDIRLACYAAWATGFDVGARIATATSGAYPRSLGRQVTEDGAFFLDASSAGGSGPYQLTWTVDSSPDNEIPGVTLPPSPVGGSLTADTDLSDVYAVRLEAGQPFSASVEGTAGTDCDLYLFEPDKARVWADAATQWAGGSTYPDGFTYTPPATGTYYLMVRERSGASAAYSIAWAGPTTDTTPPVTTASGVPSGWSRIAVVAAFTAEDAGSGVQATEYSLDDGLTYTPGASVTISAPGVQRLLYRSRDFAGNTETAREATVRIDPDGPTTSALARVVVRRGRRATFSFKVRDRTPTAKVRIRVYAGKRLRKTFTVGVRPTGRRQTWVWRRCTLPRGRYTWKVLAVDLAGNPQARMRRGALLVR